MIRKEAVIIIVLVGLVALLSCLNLNSTASLSDKLARLQGEINSLRHDIHHEMGSVSRTVSQIQDESRWWAPGRTEVLETGTDQVSVKFSWYLREHREGCPVFINYRRQGDEHYTTMEAEAGGSGGYFYAVLPIEIPNVPLWFHYVSARNGRQGEREEMVEVDEPPHYYDELQHEYYISVEDEGTVRTGEVRFLEIYHLRHLLYSPLKSDIFIDGNHIYVHLSGEGYYESRHTVQEVYLESRKGSRVIQRWPLEEEPEFGRDMPHSDLKFYHLAADAVFGEDYDALALVVTYSNGQSFTRETTF